MQYKEIICKSACNKIRKGRLPYEWDLNIYRGCSHHCQYCYAMYSHKYLNDNDYFNTVYVKKNIVEVLEKELSSKNWKRKVINIGGVTDSYQSIEKQYQLMPDILRLMIKYKNPIIISTKSDLILRDIDLIDELSQVAYVNIAATITTMDESIRKKIEPGAVSSERRFKMLEQMKRTSASVGIHLMPIVPLITDSYQNIEEIYQRSSLLELDYLLLGTMYLRGETRKFFLDFIYHQFPMFYDEMHNLYKNGRLDNDYKKDFYKKIHSIRDTYKVGQHYFKVMKDKMKRFEVVEQSYEQLSLFDIE